jgi:hypothetical protein
MHMCIASPNSHMMCNPGLCVAAAVIWTWTGPVTRSIYLRARCSFALPAECAVARRPGGRRALSQHVWLDLCMQMYGSRSSHECSSCDRMQEAEAETGGSSASAMPDRRIHRPTHLLPFPAQARSRRAVHTPARSRETPISAPPNQRNRRSPPSSPSRCRSCAKSRGRRTRPAAARRRAPSCPARSCSSAARARTSAHRRPRPSARRCCRRRRPRRTPRSRSSADRGIASTRRACR